MEEDAGASSITVPLNLLSGNLIVKYADKRKPNRKYDKKHQNYYPRVAIFHYVLITRNFLVICHYISFHTYILKQSFEILSLLYLFSFSIVLPAQK